ncbi:unnamed protein product [Cuscuta europaea]|uniref:Gnk2-homologous domain-containing protein n=1 Tax=Cuscuta europaea TaxID=41803 RepID=A0A9P1A0D0_CUSEU|nr:unnamed protein product [Cuscuta europaea]
MIDSLLVISSMLGNVLYFFISSILIAHYAAGISFQPVSYRCNNTDTPNSTYRSNLNSLLSTLGSNASRPNGFYYSAAGDGNATAYGLFLCRGDVSTALCSACVSYGGADIMQRCPHFKTVVVWYDECMLRYSDRPMYGKLDLSVSNVLFSQNDPRPETFMVWVGKKLGNMVNRLAGDGGSGRKYVTDEAKFSGNETIYSVEQCTPDLSDEDCQDCVSSAIQYLVTARGNRALYPSCNVRNEMYPFYNTSVASSPPLLPPLPPPLLPLALLSPRPLPVRLPMPEDKHPPAGKKRYHSLKVISVIVGSMFGIIFIINAIFYHGRTRKAKNRNVILSSRTDVASILTAGFSEYDYATIQAITNDFSTESKIGEGGYGFVHKSDRAIV